VKARRKTQQKTDPEQSRLFIKKAREIGADEDQSRPINYSALFTRSRISHEGNLSPNE
jgi:hypothetical protein